MRKDSPLVKSIGKLLYIFIFAQSGDAFAGICHEYQTFLKDQYKTVHFVNEVKNFNLTEEKFYHLLTELKKGENILFKQIFLAHADDCIKYLQIQYKASYDNAYDSMVETMINFRARLIEGKISYGNLRFLFLQMASQHYLKSLKKEHHSFALEDNEIEDVHELDEEHFREEQLAILEASLQKMEGECKEILQLNYFTNQKLYDIAILLGKSYEALRKQKERCMQTLVKLFNENSNF